MKCELFNTTLSIEVRENLYFYLKDFLASHPDWNQQQVINASLESFLGHNPTAINSEIYQVLAQEIQAQSILK